MTYARPKDDTQGYIPLDSLNVLYNEVASIPLIIGAEKHLDVPMGGSMCCIDRFTHICVQETYANFSPEELRWKHELHSRITGLNG